MSFDLADRVPPHELVDERSTLVAFLDYLRESVALKLEGLDLDDAAKPVVPSGTNLLELVQHLADVELYWFSFVFAGRAVDGGGAGASTVDGCVERYRNAVSGSNAIVNDADDLERIAAQPAFDGRRPTLRWILVHMLEETGRHAGHADLARELIDGTVGR
jgi:hypothetical protein